jgi:hypothetical protein
VILVTHDPADAEAAGGEGLRPRVEAPRAWLGNASRSRTSVAKSFIAATEPVIAILDERHHHILADQRIHQLQRMGVRDIRVGNALKDTHRAGGFDHVVEDQMVLTVLDQGARDDGRFGIIGARLTSWPSRKMVCCGSLRRLSATSAPG